MVNRIVIRKENDGYLRCFPDIPDDGKDNVGVCSGCTCPLIRLLDGRPVSNRIREGYPSSRMSVPPSIRARAIRTQVSLSGSPATVKPMKAGVVQFLKCQQSVPSRTPLHPCHFGNVLVPAAGRLITTMSSLSKRSAFCMTYATAWADSSAGIIPWSGKGTGTRRARQGR